MKEIVNYRHVADKDFGTFEKDGKTQVFNNISILSLDYADTEWANGKPAIDKVPFELIERALPKLDPSNLSALIGKHFILEKEAKVYQGKLSEKVTGIYFFD